MTTDLEGEVSIIYMSSRKELEHRIWRFTSDESPASYPLPRTNHIISNVKILQDRKDSVIAASNWLTQCYRNKEQVLCGGYYEHTLARTDDGFKNQCKEGRAVERCGARLCGRLSLVGNA